ncbi:MAG: universal stress protein, partial [Deltaproteobacteria bacterium]|nr:universal stress protein [Deltaproteobacteria bacterium]
MIIAAIDFTEVSLDVARLAARIARRFGDKLILVHAVEHLGSAYGGALPFAMDLPPLIDAGWEAMRRLQSTLVNESVSVEIEARVVVGEPNRAIEDIANEKGARLIVAG